MDHNTGLEFTTELFERMYSLIEESIVKLIPFALFVVLNFS